ncbi:hypothetical protein OPV22_011175 [Ensete ventricosum]|uniref:Uncharacterized protein n=1 Tax=Ensete ventricosum TaxID=4639 RepID=A0AAV8RMX3_ENSVE|nr:hypothetical protein OPV22_011175 [Ensete ventricosum]
MTRFGGASPGVGTWREGHLGSRLGLILHAAADRSKLRRILRVRPHASLRAESSGRRNPVDGGFRYSHREPGVRIPAYLATRLRGQNSNSIDALAEPKERI